MGYVGDVAKFVTSSVNDVALNAGKRATVNARAAGMVRKSANTLGNVTSGAVKYGTYSAAGAGIIGGIYGAVSQDETMVGGSMSGAGLGAVGGASIGAIAISIAKGIR